MVTVEEYLLAADELVAKILSQWDLTSTALAASIALFSILSPVADATQYGTSPTAFGTLHAGTSIAHDTAI